MNNVYIGNLDLSATEDQARALLEPHGSIATVLVPLRSRDLPMNRRRNNEGDEPERARPLPPVFFLVVEIYEANKR